MEAQVMFLDCPAYLDGEGAQRCGLPTEVEDRYTANSTGGPVDSVKILCPCGHWFNGPIDLFTLRRDSGPTATPNMPVKPQPSQPPVPTAA